MSHLGVTSTTAGLGEVRSWHDPRALLEFAWAMEPPLRFAERRAALDRLEALLASEPAPAALAGRDFQLELWAERALDAAAAGTPADALELAGRVLADPDGASALATARATLARGQALAATDTEEISREAEGLLVEAAERFGALGHTEWQGFTLFWIGQVICFETGRLLAAERHMVRALAILPDLSPRRSTVLTVYAEMLIDLGAWDRADGLLDEADRLAEIADDARSRDRVTWSRAHIAAGRGDSVRTERLFREVERDASDWWQTDGARFLCDAARTLDTLGLTDPARGYLGRARTLLDSATLGAQPDVEDFALLAQAQALILARSGDPSLASEELQALTGRHRPETHRRWRFDLLGAWAILRAGDRDGAATAASSALEAARTLGAGIGLEDETTATATLSGLAVATAGEPDITAALAPLAAEAGCAPASALLAGGGGGGGRRNGAGAAQLVIRLFGTPEVTRADGAIIDLPAGRPAELVRMLALHPHGLPVEVVLEEFFPDTAPQTSRHRLRQVLTRLRAAAGEIVIRDEDMLKLAPAWVDVREFQALARRARASRGTRELILSVAACALAGRGPLLVTDSGAGWAEEFHAGVAADLKRLEPAHGR